jgi:two-component system cell cycle sensor histidine kinase/response regulator CckA
MAEEALRQSQASLAEAQRIAHIGNWEWHIPTDELHWSDEIYRIFGLTPQQFASTYEAFLEAVHPEDRHRVQAAMNNALYQGQPYEIGHRVVRPDAQERFVFEQGEVTFDAAGKPLRMLGTVQDITEIKRAQNALEESERRYRLLAENVSDVIWTMDLDLRLTYVSPSVALFSGFTPEEAMALTMEELLTPPSLEVARSTLVEELALARQGPEAPARAATLELEHHSKDGGTVWAEVKATFLRDAQGELTGVLGVTRDITSRRYLEEQLRQAQKMEVVGRLAGGVAHDFNNLLTAILGYCELLLAAMDEGTPEGKDVTEIKLAAERAALLTRQLLAFSRRQVLRPKRLDLNAVIENLGKMLERVIGEDIELALLPGPRLGQVMADPVQIEQVILNLAVNARDAMPQGGRLTIKTANVNLDENYARLHAEVEPGPYVLLAVSDTGCGMDVSIRSNIFEPFFTTKEAGIGTGLGLSMVYGIVKQSGGHIWVYSEPGQGTVFKIYLPRLQAARETAASGPAAEIIPQGRETILLVEDEEVVRQVTHRILQRQGYTVLDAKDGQDALEILEQHPGPVHLMVTDLVMPGMNGRELALKMTAAHPEIKVLYMSGYAENGIVNQGVLEEGIVYIQKPFEARVLAYRVRELLDASLPRH